jgi:2-polyprenyl-3-methyl-5-hydroxy-6-metoxy-1,4-benzoquinol methylase
MSREADLTQLWKKPDRYFQQDRIEMLGYIPEKASRILDVGCGEGSFGAIMRGTHNAEVWGIEIDEQVAEAAKAKLDRVFIGDVAQAMKDLPESYFDCIVFNDILEHLPDPYQLLEQTKSKLTSSGVIVCSVPNVRYYIVLYRFLIQKNWRYSDSGVMDKTHLRFFTFISLKAALQQVGYEILTIEGINPTSYWGAHLLKLGTLGWLGDCIYPQIACVARPYMPQQNISA